MSHFSVMVLGDNVEQQLAPFQENNMGDCPKQYLTFHDQEDKLREEYETGSIRMVMLPTGELVLPWDERFRVPGSLGLGSHTHQVPEGLEQRDVPFRERYPDLETFAADWHFAEARDPEIGRYGHWENPNAKWDWYQVGGLFSGRLRAKTGEQVDQLRLGDLDLETPQQEAAATAFCEYEAAAAVIAGRAWETLDSVIARAKQDESVDVRQAYWEQPAVKQLSEHLRKDPWITADEVDRFLRPRADYIELKGLWAIGTFAYLEGGAWHERGSMGWFGHTDNKADELAYLRGLQVKLKALPPSTLVTVVDCHI